jgi:hypothetical protein
VIEPHGKSVFADHRLPFVPSAWALDHDPDYPTANRDALLCSRPTASRVARRRPLPVRLAPAGRADGALTIAALYLLTRVLFRRREVAVLVGLFALLDGLLFVQSRIAMNDVYTGAFIVAAYALFAWLWSTTRAPAGRSGR